jgi:hypothetical protein
MGNVGGIIMPMAGSSGTASDGGAAPGALPPVMESGMATAKYCNGLVDPADGSSVELVLELGSKPVRFTAASGKCSPATGVACSTIPAGNIPFRLTLGTEVISEGIAPLEAGKPVAIVTYFDKAGMFQIGGVKLSPPRTCEAYDPFVTADGGAPGPAPDAAPGPTPDAAVPRPDAKR